MARLVPLGDDRPAILDPALFERIVAAAFGQRRKTLRNALGTLASERLLEAAGIDPGTRAERLRCADFVRLSNAGLSCPDWPTCYGKATWPTHAEQVAGHAATEIRPVEPGKAWLEQFHRHIAASLGLLVFALAERVPARTHHVVPRPAHVVALERAPHALRASAGAPGVRPPTVPSSTSWPRSRS